MIEKLANVKLAIIDASTPRDQPGSGETSIDPTSGVRVHRHSEPEFDIEFEVPAVDPEAQRARAEAKTKRDAKELDQLKKNIASLDRQLSDEAFLGKAPPAVIEKMRANLATYKAQRDKLL
jgi:valyl-tRNA synthetase